MRSSRRRSRPRRSSKRSPRARRYKGSDGDQRRYGAPSKEPPSTPRQRLIDTFDKTIIPISPYQSPKIPENTPESKKESLIDSITQLVNVEQTFTVNEFPTVAEALARSLINDTGTGTVIVNSPERILMNAELGKTLMAKADTPQRNDESNTYVFAFEKTLYVRSVQKDEEFVREWKVGEKRKNLAEYCTENNFSEMKYTLNSESVDFLTPAILSEKPTEQELQQAVHFFNSGETTGYNVTNPFDVCLASGDRYDPCLKKHIDELERIAIAKLQSGLKGVAMGQLKPQFKEDMLQLYKAARMYTENPPDTVDGKRMKTICQTIEILITLVFPEVLR